MPIGVARASVLGATAKEFLVAISASTSNINLRTVANAAGYSGGDCKITINSGVDVWSASTGAAALVPGSWPSGVTVTLIINGTISGCGGNGGNSQYYACAPNYGGNGGTALAATGISGFTFKVDNGSGTIRGGGGGGAASAYNYTCCCPSGLYPGGGGGGGQGHNGGAGGNGALGGGTGGNGSPSAPGAGGAGYQNGGNGGTWGSPGASTYGGGYGGSGGNSVTGNSNITWINTGTRTGLVS
jgi:hypothetical protein